jgi:hypothetical protein
MDIIIRLIGDMKMKGKNEVVCQDYDIVSVSLTRDGRYGTKAGKLLVRTERINIATNELFKTTDSVSLIKNKYEAFWMLDDLWKNGQCKVLSVIPVAQEKPIEFDGE